MKRPFLALFAVLALAAVAEAGPIRDRIQARREARSAAFTTVAAPACSACQPQASRGPVTCFNCTNAACQGGTCACFGAGYYCDTAKCPIVPKQMAPFAFQSPCAGGKCQVPARL